MSLWTNSDAANGAPKFAGVAGANTAITGSQMFGNTQIGAFSTGLRETTGIFGVDTTEQTVSATSNTHPQHAGWVLVTRGTGPIVSITANTGAANASSGYLTFTGGGVGANQANVLVTVDANNRIQNTSFTINDGGNYLIPPVGVLANGLGASNAVFTFTLGGRAGRSQTETLVAMGSLGNVNATGIASAVFVADTAADNAIFPNS
jgi:hypothetical protein